MRINPEKKEDRERIARELLRVTLQLAGAHGFVSLGLREVSRAAEIAPTSFYRHFADMEELGRELIETLAGPFVAGWVASEPSRAAGAADHILAVAHRAIAAAQEDADLMRFILAERRGAIPTFRDALAKKLAVVSSAFSDALAAEGAVPSSDLPVVADAIVSLILDACGDVLDAGADRAPSVSERLAAQIRLLLAGATTTKARR